MTAGFPCVFGKAGGHRPPLQFISPIFVGSLSFLLVGGVAPSRTFKHLDPFLFGIGFASKGPDRSFTMSLSIEIRRLECAVVLELSGRLSIFEQNLRHCVWELIENGDRIFVINLANVSYLDNSGLGQLCLIYTMLKNRGGDLKLVRPTPRIRRLLGITKLDTVFEVFEHETEAVRTGRALSSAVSA
jgi:anti-sigma B factor antagonist